MDMIVPIEHSLNAQKWIFYTGESQRWFRVIGPLLVEH